MSLLEGMLILYPDERISVDVAMSHAFLASLHDIRAEVRTESYGQLLANAC
jgi:hypothetical protein